MTRKLYWQNPHLVNFKARITNVFDSADGVVLELDQTAFYPESGGQPSDLGTINQAKVEQVLINDGGNDGGNDDGRILHHLSGNGAFAVGDEVSGEISWARRREMIQQHTGQHILSQAFFQLFGAETRGFRITEQTTEIDLALELNADEIEAAIIRAEELANAVVFDDREIRTHELTPEEAAKLPLRKESFVTDCVRVIEIADFDWSPCGGTHAQRTGEVGLIAVRGWERAKKMTRLQFVAGVRALSDYRAANKTAASIARAFTVGRDEAEASVARMVAENKTLTRRVREMAQLTAQISAEELYASAKSNPGSDKSARPDDGRVVVTHIFEDRDFEEIKLIAHHLVEHNGVVALLASREVSMARLVFARSADAEGEMNLLMKIACERLNGRGGGKPDFAQGGGSEVAALEDALEMAKANYWDRGHPDRVT